MAALAIAALTFAVLMVANAFGGTFRAGGGRLAFLRGTLNTSPCGSIYTMNGDGSHERQSQVVRQPVCFPSWSPDGTRIAFSFMAGKAGIFIVEADGSRSHRVTTGRTDSYPSWSPNGGMLAFVRGLNLYAVSADGRRLRPLTRITAAQGVNAAAPAWSSDGRHIAFQLTGAKTALVVLDLSSGKLTRLGKGGSPSWSPDGKELVFASARGLEIAGLDGSKARLLVPGDGPSWSPDGRKIAYWWHTSGRGLRSAVYVVNVDGAGAHRLSTGPYDTTPDWLQH
jgi:Tol biopolymer transport system component